MTCILKEKLTTGVCGFSISKIPAMFQGQKLKWKIPRHWLMTYIKGTEMNSTEQVLLVFSNEKCSHNSAPNSTPGFLPTDAIFILKCCSTLTNVHTKKEKKQFGWNDKKKNPLPNSIVFCNHTLRQPTPGFNYPYYKFPFSSFRFCIITRYNCSTVEAFLIHCFDCIL